MKTRRLLALVLCFVMLFSDATSTLASTNSGEPIVITDSSELEELLNVEVIETEAVDTEVEVAEVPETDVASTEETSEEAESTETTEVVVPEKGTETPVVAPEETTEEVDTTEVGDSTEESEPMDVVEMEEVENVKTTSTTSLAVVYTDTDNDNAWEEIGTYTSFTDALAGINSFLAENAGFDKNIQISMQADATLDCNLDLNSLEVQLDVDMSGYTLTVAQDATIRADVYSSGDALGTVEVGAGVTLSLLPFDPCNTGNSDDTNGPTDAEYTNLQNIIINFDSTNPGNLVVGQAYYNGALTNAHMRLNDVAINNAKNITFEGNVGYDWFTSANAAMQLTVSDTFTITNVNDFENGIWQNAELLISTTCNNMVLNGYVVVDNLTVTNTLTASAAGGMKVWDSLNVKDIYVTVGNSEDNSFELSNSYLHDANGNYLSRKATIEISGTISGADGVNCPVNFVKIHDQLNAYTNPSGAMKEEHWEQSRYAYDMGEVIAKAPNADSSMVRTDSYESKDRLLVSKNTSGEFIAEKVVVQVWVHDDEKGETVKEILYSSWDAAIAGLATDFTGVEGRYNMTIYDDITLSQDTVFPDSIAHICINAPRLGEPIFDSNNNWIGDRQWIVCPVVDLNGHSITANGDIEWAEVIKITNSSTNASEIYIKAEANPGPDGYWPSFRGNWFDEGIDLFDTEGNAFTFGTEYTFIDNVNIRVPNGRAEFSTVASGTHIVNGELIVSSFKGHQGKWELSDVTIVGATDGSFIHESSEVTITGKTTWLGGAGVEVRGTLTFGEFFMNANEEDPYANMWVEIAELYDRDKEGTDEYFLGKGKLTFAGTIGTAEGFKGGNAVYIDKKEIYYYQATDEEGNKLYHDEAKTEPMIWEDQRGGLSFENGETVAYVTNSAVSANLFGTNSDEVLFVIENQELKANKASVLVDIYIPEEDRGVFFRYQTLEEAFANLEKDFEGRETNYTVSILDDVTLTKDIVVPDFVTNLRLQSKWNWVEHYDENGEPIRIYDEEGNEIGIEGHNDVFFTTLDLNGHSITANGTYELIEGLQIVSTGEKGVIVSNAVTGGEAEIWAAISISQEENAAFIGANGEGIDRNSAYQWTFLDNVDVVADNGLVNLWSRWANYTVNGNIHANEVYVRGNWTAKDVTALNDGCIDSGWYDEATDEGEPEGYLTVDNFTIEAGHMYQGGRLVVKDTFTANWALVENYGDLIAEKIVMPTGSFANMGRVQVKEAAIERLVNDTQVWYNDETGEFEGEAGSMFICDTYTQNGSGYTWLIGSSSFIVNEKADIYNLRIGAENGDIQNPANLHRMPNAAITIKGSVERRNDWTALCYGVFDLPENAVGFGLVKVVDTDEAGNVMGIWFEDALVDANGNKVAGFNETGWPMQVLQRDEVLFTVETEFPVECIGISQPEEGARYWSAYQMDDKVLVGGNWIHVSSTVLTYGPNGEEVHQEEFLKEFSVWSDAIEYINKLSNPNIGYIIALTDDINANGPLTLPEKATKVIIGGAREEQVTLTYEGDITVDIPLYFDNIKLNAVNNDGTPYYSVVKLNDSTLAFTHSAAEFASITGTKASNLTMHWGSSMKVTGAISGIEKLEMHESTLEAGGKITLKDIVSLDNKNRIIVTDANSLTITGTITGPSVYDENCWMYAGEFEVADDFTFNVTEEHPAIAKVRASAIDITVKSLVGKYKEGDALVNAPNVPATWFVVGSGYDAETGERTSITSLTYKEDATIYYGQSNKENLIVELRIYDDNVEDFIIHDSYATLAEAFAAIDNIGNEEGRYYIALTGDVEIATLTTPSKARAVQIWVEGEAPKTITYGGDMKLNCHFLIANAILAPQSDKSKINLGDYSIDLLCGTKVADGCKITGVTGSGVAKDSAFDVHDTTFVISGDIKNVGTIWLQSAELVVEGSVNAGDIVGWVDADIPEATRKQTTLVGTAKVTRTNGKVTKVEPQITLTGEMWYEQSDVYIALQEKQADGTYKLLDFQAAEMADVLESGIQLVKAPKMSSMMLLASAKNNAGSYITAKDNGYVVVRKSMNEIGVKLMHEYETTKVVWNEELGDYETVAEVLWIQTNCENIADAVKEIDNFGVARTYILALTANASAISLAAPTALKMPNAKNVEALAIMSETGVVDLHYTGNITFTSDVVLGDVNLVQVTKSGDAYVSVNTQKSGYPAAVSVSTGGNVLTIAGAVTFNTPVKLDGKKTGSLSIMGSFTTATNGLTGFVCGSITNFANIFVFSNMKMYEYVSGSKYVAPTVSTTSLYVADQVVFDVYSYDVAAKATVTNVIADNGEFYVQGTSTIKNAELYGGAWVGATGKLVVTDVSLYDYARMQAAGDFTISGTVTSYTPNAMLMSSQKSATDVTPTLDIKGKVVLSDPANKIGIMVTDSAGKNAVTLTGAPNASGMLLTAKNAAADMFKAGVLGSGENKVDNVGGKGAYSEANPNGYVLAKSGSNIYVYYGNEINVELSKNEEVLGYYNSIADATKVIDALKDKEATYMVTLLNSYGIADAPVELKLPKYANTVAIQKNNGKMYFKGKVSLSASTALVVASEAEFAGDVTGKGTFAIGRDMTVIVKGKFDAANLALNGGSVLDARQNVVTIGTIVNNRDGQNQNKIIYGKDAKNVSYLTIKGWVSGSNTNPVLLQLISDTAKASYALDSEKGQVILDNTQKIATIEKAALSSFEVMINDETFYIPDGEPRFTYQLVKANKGVYHVDIDTDPDWLGTWLEFTKEGKTYVTCCLDYAQAVNEINTLADKDTDYIINICRKNTTIWDVNLTDTKAVSPITMPKANVANSVTIAYSGFNNWQRGIEFTGNISYAGNLGFVNCEIKAANISKVKTLTLENTAFVTTGTVKVEDVVIKGNTTWDAFGKTTINGLDATEKGDGSYLASKSDAKGVPTFTVNGDVPTETVWKVIKTTATADTAANSRYISTYKDVSLVVAKAAGADRFIAYPFADADASNNEGITNLVAYKDTKNAVKNGNGNDMKVLLSYEGGSTYTKSYDEAVKLIDSIGNKEGDYTIQFLTGGTKENPAGVTTTGAADSYGKLNFPKKAASVEIAGMTDVDGNPTTVFGYTGTMKPSVHAIFRNIILTEGAVASGKFTPSYAVTLAVSKADIEVAFLDGAKTLKKDAAATADLVFNSISGKGKLGFIDKSVEVAGALSANAVALAGAANVTVEKDVKVNTFEMADVAVLETAGKFTAKTVTVYDWVEEYQNAVIDADQAISITDIDGEGYTDSLRIVTNRTAANESQLTISGEISGTSVDVAMNVLDSATGKYREMTTADATALLVTDEDTVPAKNQQIATAPKASTDIWIMVYDVVDEAGNKDWVYFDYIPNENPEEEPDWITTYKHDGGMYITSMPALATVYGVNEDSEYYAQFMNWEQAVKEIDKRGDKEAYYNVALQRNVGQNLDGTLNPLKNLTLPSKAAQVVVLGGCSIFFTGNKIVPKTNTVFVETGLMAVKEVKEGTESWYESTSYDVNIGNNYVVMDNIQAWTDVFTENGEWLGTYENLPGTVSGAKKGMFEFHRAYDTNANNMPATLIKGVGTVVFWDGFHNDTINPEDAQGYAYTNVPKGITGVDNLILNPYVHLESLEGDISVKNVDAAASNIVAKNITVKGTANLESAWLVAGTEVVGDGAVKLANVVLDSMSGISAKQDKNGKSLIQITGIVSAGAEYEGETEGMLQIELWYNDRSAMAQLYNKMVLLTAPKADASWFAPVYSWSEDRPMRDENGEVMYDEFGNVMYEQEVDEEGNPIFDDEGNPVYVQDYYPAMGWPNYGYGVYKLGKEIYYGKLAE